MTKEECFKRHQPFESILEFSVFDGAMNAMDEYAMQDSIGFFRWLQDNPVDFIDDTHDKGRIYKFKSGWPRERLSESELYQLYQNSKK